MRRKKLLCALALCLASVFLFTGCEKINSVVQGLRGDLVGISFSYNEYDSFGNPIMSGQGKRVNLEGVRVTERGYGSDGQVVTNYSLSSVINITVDGRQHVSSGSSLIFIEGGLSPVELEIPENLGNDSGGLITVTSVASWLNSVKNSFGSPKVVIIKSELGYPLAVFEGDSVYWEVAQNLPKTTRISIDGKALYIHRVQFDIIDLDLL